MPKKRCRKTKRGNVSVATMNRAAKLVMEDKMSLRDAAKAYGLVTHVTLYRFVTKIKTGNTPTVGYNPATRVFSEEQEKCLEKYVMEAADRYYGMGATALRRLAYEMAVKHSIKHPTQWNSGIKLTVSSIVKSKIIIKSYIII